MLFVLIDALVPLPRLGLQMLFLTWAVVTIASGVYLIVRWRRGRRSLAATARRVELEFPELGSRLINLVQLSGQDGEADGEFARAAATQAALEVADFRFDRAAARETRWRRLVLCLQTPRDLVEAVFLVGGILAFAFLMNLLLPHWSSAASRLLRPWSFVPTVGSVKIVKVTPGDTELLIGSSLEIAAEIDNPDHRAYPAMLYVLRPGESEAAQALVPDENNQKFVAALPQVLGPLQYRLEVGDTQTQQVCGDRAAEADHHRGGGDLQLPGLPGPRPGDRHAKTRRPGRPAIHPGGPDHPRLGPDRWRAPPGGRPTGQRLGGRGRPDPAGLPPAEELDLLHRSPG